MRHPLKRALTPATNPAGIGSSAAAIYAAIVMIVNATHHHAVIDPQVVIAALGAAGFLYARFKVTPVADPKDGNGQPLVSAAALPVITVNTTGGVTGTGTGLDVSRQIAAAVRAAGLQQKTLIPPAAAAAEQPPAAAGPAGPAVPE